MSCHLEKRLRETRIETETTKEAVAIMQARDAGGWDRVVAVDLVRKGRFWKYFESKANEISGRTTGLW